MRRHVVLLTDCLSDPGPEIARRLAKLASSPFLKLEASRFTEVGYVGRDVESMIRDLTGMAVDMVREEEAGKIRVKAEEAVEERGAFLALAATRGAGTRAAGLVGDQVAAAADEVRQRGEGGLVDPGAVLSAEVDDHAGYRPVVGRRHRRGADPEDTRRSLSSRHRWGR